MANVIKDGGLDSTVGDVLVVDDAQTLDPIIETAIKTMTDADVSVLLKNAYKKLDEFEQRISALEGK